MSRMKFFLSITLVLLATIPTIILSSPTANAWDGALPNVAIDLAWDWQEQFQALQPSFDVDTGSLAIFDNGGGSSGVYLLAWTPCEQGMMFHRTWNNRIKVSDGCDIFYTQMNPTTQSLDPGQYNSNGAFWYGNGYGDFYAYAVLRNIGYSPEYIAGEQPEYDDTPLGTGTGGEEPCDPLDVACWLGNFTGTVVDGFQSLGDMFASLITGLGNWIANLIMPANEDGSFDNRFTEFFTAVNDTMTQRLGFLLFPFEFVADLFASFSSVWNPGGTEGCSGASVLSVPNLLGENDVSFNLCAIEDTPIWTPAVTVLRFVWIVGVVGFLHKKYFSVVRG